LQADKQVLNVKMTDTI